MGGADACNGGRAACVGRAAPGVGVRTAIVRPETGARGVRYVRSQGGGSSSYWAHEDGSGGAAGTQAGHRTAGSGSKTERNA
ncbi:hypothetical protein ACFCV8_21465 [Streptomyces sp. NPDC056347]|uniref:hypothetical protein n=1 Tax=Streptomyces sp. NPDC056347 TaxID=3345790 RepID=UPI0035DFD7AF